MNICFKSITLRSALNLLKRTILYKYQNKVFTQLPIFFVFRNFIPFGKTVMHDHLKKWVGTGCQDNKCKNWKNGNLKLFWTQIVKDYKRYVIVGDATQWWGNVLRILNLKCYMHIFLYANRSWVSAYQYYQYFFFFYYYYYQHYSQE